MATWQFDVYLKPAAAAAGASIADPETVDLDDLASLPDSESVSRLRHELDSFMRRFDSWNSAIESWGHEEGNCVHLMAHGGNHQAKIRIDARGVDADFVGRIAGMACRLAFHFVTPDGKTIDASRPALLAAMAQSDSVRFVRDPKAFLREWDRH